MTEGHLNPVAADTEAIRHLKQSINSGKQWYIALLEAIELWNSPEEVCNERHYQYLVGGEAFDWLLLAERLCLEVNGYLPEAEIIDLLFFARPPIELSQEEFSRLIGSTKYRAYLNYFYGVIVEEALVLVVEEEVRKDLRNYLYPEDKRVHQEVYHRVYGSDVTTLLKLFRNEKGYPFHNSITLTERKEFTYWLFNYRVEHCERAKVASDTKKALEWLQQQQDLKMKRKPVAVQEGHLIS